ncbi:MAG: Na+/H+ antiporter NhaC family protein [Mogibacterium diversum]|jgi:Na+/H+ antiporter|uniref:Sodium:proton antiporter n=2 Tax=Mogibacterium diversum TaxID=114527 RepID=A0A2S0L3U9_9FIRM|nr:Na+/H+ antiporter NhaC family protein [Mogibacterium diversum]AVM47935.1 sodium:proton antiporter [Mogibacterium diversum]MBF1319477.1 Na+/H+ antiporter NhaC family protein [Mogibacterium diversum]MBF1341803.1 Na+/H+ antiporter NhaC family protein [Mogibacterium diversum]UQF80695.1 MAG: Na+/H+ antiporter NhaC family protein [Mogibacterium diversum]
MKEQIKLHQEREASGLALIPLLFFIVIYLGVGIVLHSKGVEMAFYQFPSVVAMTIAVILAFLMYHKTGIDNNFKLFARGAGDENIMTMLMIFLLAGAFSSVAGAMGGVSSTANLGLAIIPPRFIVPGIFIIAAFLSTATGTSMGTVGAIVPIAYNMAKTADLNMSFVVAAVLTGAMFGDNLSMISDTTIAATRTQGVDLKDKFRTNAWISIPSALITLSLMVIFSKGGTATGNLDYNLIKVVPYVLVLGLALLGLNVFAVLIIGIISASAVGVGTGAIGLMEVAAKIWAGYQGMIEVFILSMFVGGLAELTKHYGGLKWIIDKTSKLLKGPKSASVGIAVLSALTDAATANNTVAIIVTGEIAKEISEKYKIDPRRTASFLDIFSCIMQGFIPYGAQFLLIASLTKNAVNPTSMIPYNWYLIILGIMSLISVVFPSYNRIVCKGEWNWENMKPEQEVEKQ